MDINEKDEITLHLTNHEALVLFDWIGFLDTELKDKVYRNSAERQISWLIEVCLESVLIEPLLENYVELLSAARKIVSDIEDEEE